MSDSTQSRTRVVLVTGAGSGIGAAVCRRVAGPGTAIVLHTRRNRDGLEAVAGEARDLGAETSLAFGDLADPETPTMLVRTAVDRFGGLDQVVANAGSALVKGIGDATVEDMAAANQAMPEAFFAIATAALPHLERSTWGRLVAISSFVAHVFGGERLFAVTAAAKAAIEALAKTLAVQLAPCGVTVNCVAPGYTRKEASGHSALSGAAAWKRSAALVPMGRVAEPDDTAAMVAFLMGRDAGHITGQVIHVDGGQTLGR